MVYVADGEFPGGYVSSVITRIWGTIGYKKWNNRGGSDGVCSGEGARWSIDLTAGTHTFRVRARDAGTQLYQIRFSTDPDLQPTDPDPVPPVTRGHRHRCNGKTGVHSHDYTNTHTHNPCPWN
jgi:hypothetical protein